MNFVVGGPSRNGSMDAGQKDSSRQPKEKSRKRQEVIALIDSRSFERECIARSILQTHPRVLVESYGSVDAWQAADASAAVVILYNIGAARISDMAEELRLLVAAADPAPVIVLAQSEELAEMIAAIELGARGYIPSSVGIDVIVEATRLTSVGGIFLPTATALALRGTLGVAGDAAGAQDVRLTPRQDAVAKALWRGKANKIIAYELNMCESTVKIHIRNILKKLDATNRTEAAFKLNARYARDPE